MVWGADPPQDPQMCIFAYYVEHAFYLTLRGVLYAIVMKDSAVRALRAKLTAGKPIHGMWLTTEAIATSELAVGLGLE